MKEPTDENQITLLDNVPSIFSSVPRKQANTNRLLKIVGYPSKGD